MNPDLLFICIIAFISLDFLLDRLVNFLEWKRLSAAVPEELAGLYDPEKYRKQQAYKKTNLTFSLFSASLIFIATLVFLGIGGFQWVDQYVRSITTHIILMPMLFFGILGLASDIAGTPLALYHTFVIEEKFGFNKTTLKTFILDKLKGYALGLVLGGGLLALMIWIWENTGEFAWLIGWGVVSAVMLFMSMFYTSLLLPLFNQLKPLQHESLLAGIQRYAAKVGFPVKEIFEMDGSKRSTKANAFFSGLGPKKKIVLYDTLVNDYAEQEIIAVLAHEVGHFKKKHVVSSVIISLFTTGITFYLLSLTIGRAEFAAALGVSEPSFHIGLVAFGLLYAPVSMITGILMNIWSRKNEFEADAYAAATNDGEALISALKKLSTDSLSTPDPHPLNVFLNYSHPPILQRIRHIRQGKKDPVSL